MIGLVSSAILGHVSAQLLQADDVEIAECSYVLQDAREICAAVTRFAILHVPRKYAHLLDAGMHE